MVGASKILTVSYGTFSCTLEGFDDPFNTMKAIAEYFRDLAADDRYFGAEPPQPDAAMLHRIAEREIQRRVEAKVQDNSVILRAGGEDPAPVPPSTPAPAPTFVAAPASEATEDSVAAKLSRIRSAVNAAAQSPAAVAPPVEATEAEATEPVLPVASLAETVTAAAEETEDWPDAVSDEFAHPVTIETESTEKEGTEKEDLAALDAAEAGIAPVEDIPAPIAELTGPLLADLPLDAGDEWVEAAFDPEDMTTFPSEAGFADLTKAVIAGKDRVEAMAAADETANLLARLAAEGATAPDAAGQPDIPLAAMATVEDGDVEEDDFALLAETLAGVIPDISEKVDAVAEFAAADLLSEADYIEDLDVPDSLLPAFSDEPQPAGASMQIAEVAPDAPALLPPTLEDLGATDEAQDSKEETIAEPAPELAEKVQRVRARVIKIRRLQPDAVPAAEAEAPGAVRPGVDAAPEARPAAAAPRVAPVRPVRPIRPGAEPRLQQPAAADSVLSPEAEADLMRALEGLGLDTPADPAPATSEPVTREPAANEPSARPQHPDAAQPTLQPDRPDRQEDPVKRLLDETNTQLDVPENRRRLSAIAHLKAAVAATVADRRAGLSRRATDEERMDPYRSDLSRIVGPARSTAPDAPARPAPLVLVSAQRVDQMRPAATPAAEPAPMQEPEVEEGDFETEAHNIFADQDFADFADRLGAATLAEKLEAAAAWVSVVEGREGFTRPQLMRQVGEMAESGMEAREDALRGFGNLLRDGKIAKTRRGQYAVTEASHFLAEARKFQRRG